MNQPELLYWKTKHNNVRVTIREIASLRQVRKEVEAPNE
jgi:hypothetical protein